MAVVLLIHDNRKNAPWSRHLQRTEGLGSRDDHRQLEAARFEAVELRTGHKHGVEPSLNAGERERSDPLPNHQSPPA